DRVLKIVLGSEYGHGIGLLLVRLACLERASAVTKTAGGHGWRCRQRNVRFDARRKRDAPLVLAPCDVGCASRARSPGVDHPSTRRPADAGRRRGEVGSRPT